jgi:K+/H+ antiporter YhaU regulatory subunit KhtT
MFDFEKTLQNLGLEMEVVVAEESGAAVGQTIEELERRGDGAFFVVRIDRRDGETLTRPDPATRIAAGDGLLVVGRNRGQFSAIVSSGPGRPRGGRTTL